ncbi:MAG TPA: lamin tail domain-containing protein, partial [Planctomycetes bacterium]|nr:lamin tail domain-containing protein [Planctomycetota bacterium]
YHPPDPNHEFVELKNIGSEAINLNWVSFSDGIDFTFGSMQLNPCEYTVVAKDPNQFKARYGTGVNIAGTFTGSLDNAGEKIVLIDAIGRTILEFDYSDDWFDITDGDGFSLTVRDPNNADPNDWDDKKTWRPSATVGGSPGWDDTGTIPQLGAIVINEILAHSHAGEPDWIELYNTTGQPINIGGWFLSDSDTDDPNRKKYEIAEGTIIEPNGFVVFYEDRHFGDSNAPGCNEPFALSENGETLYLQSGQNGILTGYYDEEKFDASETNVAFGRYYKAGTDTYNFVAMSENTPGAANAYPKVGPIVISEIMYHPRDPNLGSPYTDDDDFEYVELYNITGSAVTLQEYDNELEIDVGWRFVDEDESIDFVFPLGTTIPAGGYLLLVKDEDAFNYRYTAPPGIQILEWGDGKCNNGGEKINLQMPGDMVQGRRYYIRIDRVNYSDGSHPPGEDPWPLEPDGTGQSLHRIVPANYGNEAANWQAAKPTPAN